MKALPALKLLKQRAIPLAICSSKTRKEIEYYRRKLDNNHPFISENGGGIFIPKEYFRFEIQELYNPPLPPFAKGGQGGFFEEKGYHSIRLGTEYSELRKAINGLRKESFSVKGFGDMTAEEIAETTGLNINEAKMAKERDFDEPFIFVGAIHELPLLFDAIKSKGFNYTQGRFFHILGNSDKGKAVSILIDLYKRKFGDIITIAIAIAILSLLATALMTFRCLKELIMPLLFRNLMVAMIPE